MATVKYTAAPPLAVNTGTRARLAGRALAWSACATAAVPLVFALMSLDGGTSRFLQVYRDFLTRDNASLFAAWSGFTVVLAAVALAPLRMRRPWRVIIGLGLCWLLVVGIAWATVPELRQYWQLLLLVAPLLPLLLLPTFLLLGLAASDLSPTPDPPSTV